MYNDERNILPTTIYGRLLDVIETVQIERLLFGNFFVDAYTFLMQPLHIS